SGKELRRFRPERRPESLAFHPEGRLLALGCGSDPTVILILNADTGETVHRLEHPTQAHWLAWSGNGRLLAAAGCDHSILVWDMESRRLLSELVGHRANVIRVAFGGSGLLVSQSWDGITRFWDPIKGTQLLTARENFLRFDAEGLRLGH